VVDSSQTWLPGIPAIFGVMDKIQANFR